MATAKLPYFPALTGLRAVAAGLVLVHHFNPLSPERFGWWLHNLAAETHIGVTIFFVLSGFLISYRYLDRPGTLRIYLANRLARIYPLYFLLTTLTFGLLCYVEKQPFLLGEYLLNITFLRGLFEQYLYTGIAQGWSLTVEEMFYVSAPLAFWLVRRQRQWLWGVPLLLGALGIWLVLVSQPHPWHGFFGSFSFLFQFTYPGRAVEFFVGVGLAWSLRRTGQYRAPRGLTYAGLAGVLLSLAALSWLHGPVVGALGIFTPAGVLVNNVLLPLFGIGPLLWGLVGEDTAVRRLLSSPLLQLLGKSSYAFYLIHMGVLQRLLHHWLGNSGLALLALYGLSVVLYWAVEEPLNHWLRRQLRTSAVPNQV